MLPVEQRIEGLTRMEGQITSGSRNVCGAGSMNQGNCQVAQSSHDLRSIARANTGTIFAEGHVSDRVQTILNTPMASHQFEQAEWAGSGGRETGNQVDDLVPCMVLGRAGARELADLGQSGPVRGEIGGEFGADA